MMLISNGGSMIKKELIDKRNRVAYKIYDITYYSKGLRYHVRGIRYQSVGYAEPVAWRSRDAHGYGHRMRYKVVHHHNHLDR